MNLRLAFSVIVLVTLMACSDNGCDIIDVRDYPSPDAGLLLTSFGYTCYDTTGHPTHLQLRRPGERVRVPGNICVVEFEGEFAVSWISPTNLIISLRGQRIPQDTNVIGVGVTFSPMPHQQ